MEHMQLCFPAWVFLLMTLLNPQKNTAGFWMFPQSHYLSIFGSLQILSNQLKFFHIKKSKKLWDHKMLKIEESLERILKWLSNVNFSYSHSHSQDSPYCEKIFSYIDFNSVSLINLTIDSFSLWERPWTATFASYPMLFRMKEEGDFVSFRFLLDLREVHAMHFDHIHPHFSASLRLTSPFLPSQIGVLFFFF